MPVLKCDYFYSLSSLNPFPQPMASMRSFFKAVLDSSIGTLAFDRGICTGVCVNQFTEKDGAPAIVDTAQLLGSGVTDSGALCRTLYGHTLSSRSTADLVFIRNVNVVESFTILLFFHVFQCDQESEISSSLGNIHPSGHFV